MNIATVQVGGAYAKTVEGIDYPHITVGMVGATVTFSFNKTWDEFQKTAVFRNDTIDKGEVIVKDVTDIDTIADVPHEVLTKRGKLYCGVFGVSSDGRVIPTIWVLLGNVHYGVEPSLDESTNPDLPVWSQLDARIKALEEGESSGSNVDIDKVTEEVLSKIPVPDFSQNDPNQPGHILNRTHWVETVETPPVEILPPTIPSYNATLDAILTTPLVLEVGREYKVTWKDEEYICIGQAFVVDDFIQAIGLGDLYRYSQGNYGTESTGEPFAIIAHTPELLAQNENLDPVFVVGLDEGAQILSISTTGGTAEIVHHLDPKFIEDMYYAEQEEVTEILHECSPTYDDDEGLFFYALNNATKILEVGKTYVVSWNGVEYTCIGQDMSALMPSWVALGDCSMWSNIDANLTGNSEPFALVSGTEDGLACIMALPIDGSTALTLSILGHAGGTIHHLPSKYIKDMYYTEGEEEEDAVLPETTLKYVSSLNGFCIQEALKLEVGKTYTVLWNGVEYKYEAVITNLDGESVVTLGDVNKDTGAPFGILVIPELLIDSVGYGALVRARDSSLKEVTISITDKYVIVHKIKNKYLDLDWLPTRTTVKRVIMEQVAYNDKPTLYAYMFDDAKSITVTVTVDGETHTETMAPFFYYEGVFGAAVGEYIQLMNYSSDRTSTVVVWPNTDNEPTDIAITGEFYVYNQMPYQYNRSVIINSFNQDTLAGISTLLQNGITVRYENGKSNGVVIGAYSDIDTSRWTAVWVDGSGLHFEGAVMTAPTIYLPGTDSTTGYPTTPAKIFKLTVDENGVPTIINTEDGTNRWTPDSDIFIATYEQTTYAEVVEAHNAGKAVCVKHVVDNSTRLYVLSRVEESACQFHGVNWGEQITMQVTSADKWAYSVYKTLPAVSEADNGKILTVENGTWVAKSAADAILSAIPDGDEVSY